MLKKGEIQEGQTVLLYRGFTCVTEGPVVIKANQTGELYFSCESGKHYIDGQLDENGIYIGIESD